MFTGLVEAVATVTAVDRAGGGARVHVTVRWPDGAGHTRLGDSVAVNGACLTVIAITVNGDTEDLGFDLSHETLARTTFGTAAPGLPCNVERAMRLGDRLGGHIVTGHVDGVGHLLRKTEHPAGWDLIYQLPETLWPEVVEKGSVCIDGVSLTVNALQGAQWPARGLGVTIVPHTAAHTQLLHGETGKAVHVETDIVAKHIRRLAEFAGR